MARIIRCDGCLTEVPPQEGNHEPPPSWVQVRFNGWRNEHQFCSFNCACRFFARQMSDATQQQILEGSQS